MARRWRWLGRPWFLVAVAGLAWNDHIGKTRYPGWWTGKASDVAGVVVVATLAAVVTGRRIGQAATAVAFVALKVVPGGAEAAAPVLGGVTLRDPTDLLALLALLPLWSWLGSPVEPDAPSGPAGSDAGSAQMGARSAIAPVPLGATGATERWAYPGAGAGGGTWRRALASSLPVVGALTALFATTATSCSPDPSVTQVLSRGPVVYARIAGNGPSWARSDDGGRSWERTDPPAGVEPGPGFPSATPPISSSTSEVDQGSTTSTVPAERRPAGPTEVCGASSCYRLRGQRTIERSSRGDGDWSVEHRLTKADLEELADECSNPRRGVLESVAAPDGADAGVVSLGSGGVLARDPGGTWRPHAVLSADVGAPGPSVLHSGWFWAVLAAIPVGMGAVWALGRRRSAERVAGLVLVPVGMGVLLLSHAIDSFSSYGRLDLIIALAVVALAVKVSRSRRVGRALRPTTRPGPPGPAGTTPAWASPGPGGVPPPPPPAAPYAMPSPPPRPPPPGPGVPDH